jgi:hypothetical protein
MDTIGFFSRDISQLYGLVVNLFPDTLLLPSKNLVMKTSHNMPLELTKHISQDVYYTALTSSPQRM